MSRTRMWRAVVCALTALAVLGTTGTAYADGGTRRWSAGYAEGQPAVANDVATSPDGSTVFITGMTSFGRTRHVATLAYDARTGTRRWTDEFPRSSNPEYGNGRVLAVSPDGATLYVSAASSCDRRCTQPSFDGYSTIAYDTRTGERRWVARFATEGGPFDLAVSPDGAQLFVTGQTAGGLGTATVAYAAATGRQRWVVRGDAWTNIAATPLAVSADSTRLFVAGSMAAAPGCGAGGYRTASYDTADGSVVWSATHLVAEEGEQCGTVTDLGLSRDGRTVFVTGYGSGPEKQTYSASTVAYDTRSGARRWAERDDALQVYGGDSIVSLGVDPDGSQVFLSGYSCEERSCRSVTLARSASAGQRRWSTSYSGGGRYFHGDLAVSPDGSRVFVTGRETMPCYGRCDDFQTDAPLISYAADTGRELWVTTYPDNQGNALAVSPDGASLYLAGTFSSAVATARTTGAARSAAACRTECGLSTARFNARAGSGTSQETDAAVRVAGWRGAYDATALGGAYRTSDVRGATATFRTPRVTSFTWLTRQGPREGKARVSVDGRSRGIFDLSAARTAPRTITFSGLSRKAHTVRVTVLGKRGRSSSGRSVAVDGFGFRARNGGVPESAPEIRYGSWSSGTSASASGGSYRVGRSPGASTTFTFRGRSVRWITATGPGYGRARVVVDGRARVVDLYRPGQRWRAAVAFTRLGRGQHRISVTPLGTRNAASRSSAVVVDAFAVRR